MPAEEPSAEPPEPAPGTLERVFPPGPPAPVAELVRWMALRERPREERPVPYVMLNMVSTLDGRATLGGHSGPISSRADRELFHALRAAVDGVLVGAGTIRAERYGRMIRDSDVRAERLARGMPEEPLACIVSGRLELPDDIGLLQTEAARVVVATSSPASLPPVPARVTYLRGPGDGRLELAGALAELRSRYEVRTLLCEGGPHLARELLGENLVDELFLSLSPLLAGGEPTTGEALRILAGVELQPPAQLELIGMLREGSWLFLRYRVASEERV
ncbi:MAG TPA: dihydrofolate reductase family protein [Solirubrobacteraceae bacterium]|nr:dihydrofolate reductase family protein [Solirubrobacteraceae bacterium]